MFLCKNGIPYDVAYSLDGAELLAHCVAFGEMEGNEWDWGGMRWVDRNRT